VTDADGAARPRHPRLPWPFFWAALGIAVFWNLPDLRLPPHGEHAWRDADGLGVARSFLHDGWNILYPRVAERGALSGVTGMEFPLLDWLGAAAMKVLGEHDWACRALVLAALIPLGFGTRRLARRLLGQGPAAELAAACLLLEPLVLIFSHKFMPEVPMLALLAWGVWLAFAALDGGRTRDFAASGTLLALAAVLKPTGAGAVVPIAMQAVARWRAEPSGRKRLALQLLLLAAIPCLSVAGWFAHAGRLERDFGLPLFKLSQDWTEWLRLLPQPGFLETLLGRWLHLYLLIPSCVWIALEWRTALQVLRDHPPVSWWMGAAFLVVLLFGSHNYQHSYYALPLLLPIALFLGAFAERASQRFGRPDLIQLAFLAVFAVTGLLRALPRFPALGYDAHRLADAMQAAPPGLTVATDARTPVVSLVVLHRVGWALPAAQLDGPKLRGLAAEGARLLVESSFGGWLSDAQRRELPAPLFADDQVRLYDLAGR
jgi:4-amino-4-deoxy-L-arabinose transferase-like glycosyltransferase